MARPWGGIDPGATGAVALYDEAAGRLLVVDMPAIVEEVGKSKRRRVDPVGLGDLLDMARDVYGVEDWLVEQVGGMPGQGSGFQFGFGAGLIHMGLVDRGARFRKVTPGMWKKQLGVPKDKREAAARADVLFPAHRAQFRNDRGTVRPDRAEAALLAMWGVRYGG